MMDDRNRKLMFVVEILFFCVGVLIALALLQQLGMFR